MVSTITGTLSTPVRLGAGGYASSLTIKGTIHALGPAGNYAAGAFTEPYYAAVFAPAGGDESLVNLGVITAATESTKGDNEHYGIVLGGAGTISNAGTVTGVGGIAALGTAAAYVQNSGLIVGSYYGVLLTSPGTTLQNTGSILGDETGLVLFGGGVVTNDAGGYIFSAMGPGIDARGADTIENAGMISGGNGVDLLSAQGAVDNNGIITATGAAPGGGYAAIQTYAGGTVRNSDILRGQNGVVLQGSGSQSAYFYNGGDIIVESAHFLNFSISGLGVLNYGAGVALDMTGTIVNPGFIYGRNAGILTQKSAAVTIVNSHMVYSQSLGVDLLLGGTVVNSGTIAGSVDAIDSAGSLDLMIAQGAIFFGGVTVATGDGSLALTSASAAGSLDLGGSFSGFDAISFAPGAVWTLEGNASELAAGQSIAGLLPGDTLILDGFSASSYTFAAGTGLTLSNAAGSETIALNTLPQNASFVVHSSAAGTTITPVETITNTTTIIGAAGQNGVTSYQYPGTPGEFGGAAPSIPVGTNGGRGGDGFYLSAGTFEINTGIILGGVGGYGGPGIGKPAHSGDGGTGVTAAGGTLFNQGTLEGGAGGHGTNGGHTFSEFFFGGGDGGNGGAGVYLAQGATATNSGVILGGAAGAGGAAYISSVENFAAGSAGLGGVGVILADSTLVNDGTIAGNGGVEVNNGVLIDAGSVASTTGNPAVAFGYGSGTLVLYPNAVFTGDVVANATGSDAVVLAGTGGTALLGTALRNFGMISLQPGAAWTLEGDTAALAAGQAITGFAASDRLALSPSGSTRDSFVSGDTLILDGFAATADSFAAGVGLILSNATASATLAITSAAGTGFIVTSYGAASTITSTANPLLNAGGIYDKFETAVNLNPGYTLVNTGVIESGGAISPSSPADYGLIYTGYYGVHFNGNAGNLANALPSLNNTGYILGIRGGVVLNDGGEITNSGTIAGGVEAIPIFYQHFHFTGQYSYEHFDAIENLASTFTLTAEPGAIFSGAVVDEAGTGELILAGTISGSLNAQQFSGFQSIDVAAGASWSLALDAPSFGSSQTISGLSSSDTIAISHIRGAGTIELAGFSATASSYASGTGLVLSNTTTSETLVVSGSYSTASFTVTENPDGGTDVSVACFCAGTRIATPRGNIAVENLRIGDLVTTLHGPRAIKWIGHRAYAARFLAMGGRPIRIRRHAIALNVPSRDLYVSPDHAIAEGGVLIHAHLLINGISITQPEITQDVEYFHLEFDTHSIIFAENLATESFIDEGARHRFANADTAPASTPQKPCLPRVAEGFHLHNIKTRIARRAGRPEPTTLGRLRGCIDESTPTVLRGWAQDIANPESPVLLEIFSVGSGYSKTPEIFSARILANAYRPDLRSAGIGSGCHGFAIDLPGPILTLRRAQDGATLEAPVKEQAVAFR